MLAAIKAAQKQEARPVDKRSARTLLQRLPVVFRL
jgi:hypothetical protein